MNGLVIQVARLPDDWPDICAIRYQVFQLEQSIDPDLDFDGQDEQTQQVLAYLDQVPVGTARVRELDLTTVKIERVAVLKPFRGCGIGYRLMQFVLQFLTEKHTQVVWVNAQMPVKAFYERLGFVQEGSVFEDAGIPHIRMKKLLN